MGWEGDEEDGVWQACNWEVNPSTGIALSLTEGPKRLSYPVQVERAIAQHLLQESSEKMVGFPHFFPLFFDTLQLIGAAISTQRQCGPCPFRRPLHDKPRIGRSSYPHLACLRYNDQPV